MKKIFKYLSILLTVALLGSFTACNLLQEPLEESAEVGLGIKVFFPTKVVAGQPMTINGSGFSGARAVEFPNGISVTDFEIVSNDMIRVTAPAGIAADGGVIKVITEDGEAVSRLPLTLGSTSVSGFSIQAGTIKGGEQIEVYGTDLQFICEVELPDADGNPMILADENFYRKGENRLVITIPKKVFDGTYVGKLRTFDGKEFLMPELKYEPGAEGGHWESKEVMIWENDGSHGAVSWSSDYRFANESNKTGEEIYAIPDDVWAKMKEGTFYVKVAAENPQVRITTGWWSTTWTGSDFMPGAEGLTDNGDGTWTLEVKLAGDPIMDVIDAQHLLVTGDRFTPVSLFFVEDVWVDGGGHMEIVKSSIWKNDGSHGAVAWSSDYRFANESNKTGEEIYAIPDDVWEKMKGGTFYVDVQAENPQIRITTGWWSTTWTGNDFMPGSEGLTDNGDGTWTLAVTLGDDPIMDVIDVQHLLVTGDRFTPVELYFQEEVWVGGGESGPQEVDIWKNDDPAGHGEANWNGTYRFCEEGKDFNDECIAEIPTEVWEKMKTEKFYVTFSHGDWFQVRIVTGWWNNQWPFGKEKDITPNEYTEMLIDHGDGTYTIELDLKETDLAANMDAEHLLFTGSGYTPLRLYYIE